MKVYKETCLVKGNSIDCSEFLEELNKNISKFQSEGLQIEVQYSSNPGTTMFLNYSALILGYTEE